MDTDWMSQGKCRDMNPDVFFPSDGVGVQAAQRVCLVCPVKAPCLEYALAHHIHEGVWGGTSERAAPASPPVQASGDSTDDGGHDGGGEPSRHGPGARRAALTRTPHPAVPRLRRRNPD